MTKLKLIVIAATVAALAATCAGWKWYTPQPSASQPYRIAGWSWKLPTNANALQQ